MCQQVLPRSEECEAEESSIGKRVPDPGAQRAHIVVLMRFSRLVGRVLVFPVTVHLLSCSMYERSCAFPQGGLRAESPMGREIDRPNSL